MRIKISTVKREKNHEQKQSSPFSPNCSSNKSEKIKFPHSQPEKIRKVESKMPTLFVFSIANPKDP